MWKIIVTKIADLIDVKSIITVSMTAALIAMIFMGKDIPELFSVSYGATLTYFFAKIIPVAAVATTPAATIVDLNK